MAQLQLNGLKLELLPDGQLAHPKDWNVDVAIALAQNEGLELKDAHWDIIDVIRRYYQTYNIAPIAKLLKKEITEFHGPEKATDDYLISLFPYGASVQGAKIAGVPKPVLDAELDKTAYIKPVSRHPTNVSVFEEFDFNGRTFKVHASGNLVNPAEWNEALADFIADKEGIKLSESHWEVLQFLRQFYFQYGITPMVRLLQKHMRDKLGDEKSSEAYLYGLFPGGPARQGSRIAGLPEPQGCIDQ